jgi:hypothetical protein
MLTTFPHPLHRPRFPARPAGTLNVFPHWGHENEIVIIALAINFGLRGCPLRETSKKADPVIESECDRHAEKADEADPAGSFPAQSTRHRVVHA